MLKPLLVKSLIAQNTALLRDKQLLINYLRTIEVLLRLHTKNGKDTGVVDLLELQSMCVQMRQILSGIDNRNIERMGTLRPPTKQELGRLAEADQNIMHGFFHGSTEDMNSFFSKMINDIMGLKFPPPPSDGNEKTDNCPFPINPDNFGGDLEGEWQDAPPPPEGRSFDPFSDTDLDKPE